MTSEWMANALMIEWAWESHPRISEPPEACPLPPLIPSERSAPAVVEESSAATPPTGKERRR